jgi:hypothetical protein
MLLLDYRVHQATVQSHVKMNQEEIQIKPSNMCFSLNLFYLFRNIINLYYISPFIDIIYIVTCKENCKTLIFANNAFGLQFTKLSTS